MPEKSPQDGRPAVVGADEVAEFDSSVSQQPDSLEAVVAADTQQTTPRVQKGNLGKLTEAIVMHLEKIKYKPELQNCNVPKHLYQILPCLLSARYDNYHIIYFTQNVKVDHIISPIESAFGDFFFETDLAASIGLDKNNPQELVNPGVLTEYIPELKGVLGLASGRMSVSTIANPYLTLLQVPFEQRPFLCGAMELAEQNGGFKNLPFDGIVHDPSEIATIVDTIKYCVNTQLILTYAKQVQERNVRQYLDAINSIKA